MYYKTMHYDIMMARHVPAAFLLLYDKILYDRNEPKKN